MPKYTRVLLKSRRGIQSRECTSTCNQRDWRDLAPMWLSAWVAERPLLRRHEHEAAAKRPAFYYRQILFLHLYEHVTKYTVTTVYNLEMPPRINLPPLTRGLFLVLLSLSALNVSMRFRKWSASLSSPSITTPSNYISSPDLAVPYLVLVPTTSYKFPWTAITAALVENNAVSLAISGLVIWFGGRYLERAWGSKEFAKFLLYTTMIPNIFSFCVYALWHMITSTPELYVLNLNLSSLKQLTDRRSSPTPIQGLVAVEAGFLVALKQLVPEHTVSIFKGAIRARIKHFPIIFVLANMLSGPLLGTDTAVWLSFAGFFVSWIYIRFFRITEITSLATSGEGATMKGDASDTFAFIAFFPDAAHPVLTPICDGVYNTLVQLRLCTPFSEEAIEAGNENASARSEGLPSIMNGRGGSGRRAEAERRRALALKALDQRLNAAAANRTTGAPATNVAPSMSGDGPEPVPDVSESSAPVKEAQP